MDELAKKKFTAADYLKFIIPSIIGVLLFMFPFKVEGETTIFVALLAGKLTDLAGTILPGFVLFLILLSGILTIIYKAFKPASWEKNDFMKGTFDVTTFWMVVRIIGMILAIVVFFELGPEAIWSEDTGGLILNDLLLGLVGIFLFAGFLLPFLTDFGLLEFIGSLLTPVMRPIFQLPGRSSIDCIASWVGDGTIGVALTDKQYIDGYYTEKEAAVIATNFSAVSITFSLVVLSQVDLAQYFAPWYLAVAISGVVAAIIMSRIPPLNRMKNGYYKGVKKDITENVPEGFSNAKWGAHMAANRAQQASAPAFIKNGAKTVLDMWLGVIPVIMCFGSIALIIAESTPVFDWLGIPFIPLLKLLKIPYAKEASTTMVVGFTDMFLPSVIGASIPSELTRFVIAGISISQLIYLSEVGAVILGSHIPLSLGQLFIIFLERTIITLPIIAIAGHLVF